jgi:hypothetical protein
MFCKPVTAGGPKSPINFEGDTLQLLDLATEFGADCLKQRHNLVRWNTSKIAQPIPYANYIDCVGNVEYNVNLRKF